MLARLALLFVVVPLLELILLIQLGRVVGLWPTVGLVVLTGVVGAALARAQGLRTLWAFQESMARGRLPTDAIQDGLAILV
ncbi:MAG: FxsA family protein, partial [Akkermansiaceae bacterium]|nr:FxsA family protein [Akkermansiaceae bacterium]